jgi:hypothetical protein
MMRPVKLAIAVAVAAAAVAPTLALTVRDDSGGLVLQKAIEFDRAPKPIRVMGSCRSACTLVLAYPSTCAGPGAEFVFHAPFGAGKFDERIRRWMMGRYRAPVRAWIRSRGGLTSRPVTLRGEELRRLVRAC